MSLSPAEREALRRDAVTLLEGYRPPPGTSPEVVAHEEAARARLLDHLHAEPDAVWREGPPVHLTGSCVVMSPDGAQVLLTLHRKAQLWLQFGGHAEPGDGTLRATALREAREESGITAPEAMRLLEDVVDLDAHELSSRFGHCREHLDLRFVAVVDPDDPAAQHAVSDESEDVRWWPVDALPEARPRPDLDRLIELARGAVLAGA